MQINRIVFHGTPLHPDEVGAYWLLRKFGAQKFPGIREAKLVFRTDAGGLFEEKNWKQHLAEGTLLVGTGGGPLDEHPVESERKADECATSLVARMLGVQNDRSIQFLVDWIVKNDTRGVRESSADLAAITRDAFVYLTPAASPREILFHQLLNLEALYRKSAAFWACEAEFLDRGKLERVTSAAGQQITIAMVQSANPEMARFCRSKRGLRADLVIHQGSPEPSNLQVTRRNADKEGPAKVMDMTMDKLCAIIRWQEAELHGRDHPRDARELASEGVLAYAPEWFYLHHTLHNGGFTYRGVAGSKIPLDEILKIAVKAIKNRGR